jgi:hypothetical protein
MTKMNKALVITAIAIVSLVLGLLLQGIGMWRVSQRWGASGKGWTLSLLSIAYIFVIVGIVMVIVSMIINKSFKKGTDSPTVSNTSSSTSKSSESFINTLIKASNSADELSK